MEKEASKILFDSQWKVYSHETTESSWAFSSYKHIHTIQHADDMVRFVSSIPTEAFHHTMLFCMKENIKPMWESPENIHGGCYCLRVLNEHVPDVFRLVVSALVTDELVVMNAIDHINGISISPKRGQFCILKIWCKSTDYKDAASTFEESFVQELLPYLEPDDQTLIFRENIDQKM